MRLTMICIGSTGDVKPYVLLGKELQARGHRVSICAFSDFEKMITDAGMRYFPLSGDAKEFMASIMKPGAKGALYLKQIRDSLHRIIGPFIEGMQTACEDAEAVVATYFGNIIQDIAGRRGVPFIQTHYYPMDSNTLTPISSAPGQRAGKVWYKASYKIAYMLISLLEQYYLTDWRKEQGMPPRKVETTPRNMLGGHRVPVLYAMSPLLMPRPRLG